MTDKPKKLSDTTRALLSEAANRDDYLIQPPQLPIAAARQVVKSLLNFGLAEEVPASIEAAEYAWRTADDGGVVVLRATALGVGRIREAESTTPATVATGTVTDAGMPAAEARKTGQCGVIASALSTGQRAAANQAASQDAQAAILSETPALPSIEAYVVCEAPCVARGRQSSAGGLHRAAQALLDAWDRRAEVAGDAAIAMNGPIAELRAALIVATSAAVEPSSPPKQTKQARVLGMLARDEGASGPQIAEAMGWAAHTVRGFLAGLAKKGINVAVLERVRQVGPHRGGAKGSYTIYQLANQAEG